MIVLLLLQHGWVIMIITWLLYYNEVILFWDYLYCCILLFGGCAFVVLIFPSQKLVSTSTINGLHFIIPFSLGSTWYCSCYWFSLSNVSKFSIVQSFSSFVILFTDEYAWFIVWFIIPICSCNIYTSRCSWVIYYILILRCKACLLCCF